MSSLFKDAIADAKQLREAAEANAINSVITLVTPRIRQLIESQVLSESDNEILTDGDDEEVDTSVKTVPSTTTTPVATPQTSVAANGTTANITLPDGEGKVTVDLDSLKRDGQTQASVGMGGGDAPMGSPGSGPHAGVGTMDVTLDDDAVETLGSLGEAYISGIADKVMQIEIGIKTIKESKLDNSGRLARATQLKAMIESAYRHVRGGEKAIDRASRIHLEEKLETLYGVVGHIMSEAKVKGLQETVESISKRVTACRDISNSKMTPGGSAKFGTFLKEIRNEMVAAAYIVEDRAIILDAHLDEIVKVGRKLQDMYKETREMSMRNKTLLNEEDIMLRLSLPEDSEVEASDLGVEVVDDEDGDADADDLGGEDMGDEDLGSEEDFDLGDFGGEEEEEEEPVEEGQHDNDMGPGDAALSEGEEELDENEVVEIDESVLRSEILRMQRLAEARKKAKKDDKKGAKKDDKKSKKDVKEGVKVGKPESNSDGSGPGSFEDFGGGKDEGHPFVDNTYSLVQKESRQNRALLKKLAEYKAAFEAARAKLAEANLFNAKLLYANKLLQNKSISALQRESAIDSLDKAKSLREVKLVYSSLMGASRTDKSSLSESVNRSRGSASKPTRPGSAVLNEATEVKRWALLAGISDGEE